MVTGFPGPRARGDLVYQTFYKDFNDCVLWNVVSLETDYIGLSLAL